MGDVLHADEDLITKQWHLVTQTRVAWSNTFFFIVLALLRLLSLTYIHAHKHTHTKSSSMKAVCWWKQDADTPFVSEVTIACVILWVMCNSDVLWALPRPILYTRAQQSWLELCVINQSASDANKRKLNTPPSFSLHIRSRCFFFNSLRHSVVTMSVMTWVLSASPICVFMHAYNICFWEKV